MAKAQKLQKVFDLLIDNQPIYEMINCVDEGRQGTLYMRDEDGIECVSILGEVNSTDKETSTREQYAVNMTCTPTEKLELLADYKYTQSHNQKEILSLIMSMDITEMNEEKDLTIKTGLSASCSDSSMLCPAFTTTIYVEGDNITADLFYHDVGKPPKKVNKDRICFYGPLSIEAQTVCDTLSSTLINCEANFGGINHLVSTTFKRWREVKRQVLGDEPIIQQIR